MAKAIFKRTFDALDAEKGVSVRVEASTDHQSAPEWVIAQGEAAGVAERVSPSAGKPADTKG